MFFIFGINNKIEQLRLNQNIFCNVCGQYSHYEAFMTYMVFSLFFIPVIKFSKKYYVKTACCETVYQINSDTGRRIRRGENVSVVDDDIISVKNQGSYSPKTFCPNCGKELEKSFAFCPHCGERL